MVSAANACSAYEIFFIDDPRLVLYSIVSDCAVILWRGASILFRERVLASRAVIEKALMHPIHQNLICSGPSALEGYVVFVKSVGPKSPMNVICSAAFSVGGDGK